MLRKAQKGRSVVGSKSEREMKEMMPGKVCEEEKAGVNVKKTKTIVFNKRKMNSEENEWKREGRKRTAERVQVLGLHFQRKSTDKAHMREIVRKPNKVVWGIGDDV
jgi:hypothetical protein